MAENQSSQSSEQPSNEQDTAPKLSEETKDLILEKYNFMIRPCKLYRGEYKECKRLKGRFNQYFIFGEYLDCQGWADDYNNCQKYSWRKDKDAAIDVIKSELERREERLKPHRANDIWTKRDNPPDDWSKPLPAFMVERTKNSFLEYVGKESGIVTSECLETMSKQPTFCGVM